MNITINGTTRHATDEATLAVALEDYGIASQGVAVAMNGSVVPRADWARTVLEPDAAIEVLTAVQGG